MTPEPTPRQPLLTLASGGWVLLLAGVVTLALIVWAVAPAVLRMTNRPPGDGRTVESYGFDLTSLAVPSTELVPGMLYRDMIPVMDEPAAVSAGAVDDINAEERGKYLVSSDRVIGVEIDGDPRAYPLSVMNVHEIVNDTLGGRPIAVTYNWLCDSARVFSRELDGRIVRFGVSGLVYNSNMLMYDRVEGPDAAATPSLWSQLLARAVAGPGAEAGARLTVVPSTLTSWADWRRLHPDTTVILRDPAMIKRYKHAAPTSYFQSGDLRFPVAPPPPEDGPPAKTPCVAVITKDARRVYPTPLVARRANEEGVWRDRLGDTELTFTLDRASGTVTVAASPPDDLIEVVPAFWFAWHAMHPQDERAE